MGEPGISRLITTTTSAARIEDGVELRTEQTLPGSWAERDMVIAKIPGQDDIYFFGDPEAGPDGFEYRIPNGGLWSIRLERLEPDDRGRVGLRVRFEERHKDLQRLDDERQR